MPAGRHRCSWDPRWSLHCSSTGRELTVPAGSRDSPPGTYGVGGKEEDIHRVAVEGMEG